MPPSMHGARVLIIGQSAVIAVLALALVTVTIRRFATPAAIDEPAAGWNAA